MLRFINICLVLGLVALAYVIYEVKYEARALDEEIAGLKKDIDAERDSVAVLRAEWSLLNRPERIERLAQKFLKLEPAQADQLVALDTVSDSDFQRARLAFATPAGAPSGPKSKPDLVKAPASKSVASIGSIKPTSVKTQPVKAATAQPLPAKTRLPITASAGGE